MSTCVSCLYLPVLSVLPSPTSFFLCLPVSPVCISPPCLYVYLCLLSVSPRPVSPSLSYLSPSVYLSTCLSCLYLPILSLCLPVSPVCISPSCRSFPLLPLSFSVYLSLLSLISNFLLCHYLSRSNLHLSLSLLYSSLPCLSPFSLSVVSSLNPPSTSLSVSAFLSSFCSLYPPVCLGPLFPPKSSLFLCLFSDSPYLSVPPPPLSSSVFIFNFFQQSFPLPPLCLCLPVPLLFISLHYLSPLSLSVSCLFLSLSLSILLQPLSLLPSLYYLLS